MFRKEVNIGKNGNKLSEIPPVNNAMGNPFTLNDSEICLVINIFQKLQLNFDKEYPELCFDNSVSGSSTANDIKSPKGLISRFLFHPFTYSEVLDALQAINHKCFTSVVNLDSFLLKPVAPIITQELTFLMYPSQVENF